MNEDFIGFAIAFALLVMIILTGCNTKVPEKCPKPKIQIADMTNQYRECKGLLYPGKKIKQEDSKL